MVRTITIYAGLLGLVAVGLNWLQYRNLVRTFPGEAFAAVIALGGLIAGVWLARALTPRAAPVGSFQRNEQAIRSLGLSPREMEILETLAVGDSNKEIARRLRISPNTVKTHVARVCEKLGVQRRGQAVEKARFLSLIP